MHVSRTRQTKQRRRPEQRKSRLRGMLLTLGPAVAVAMLATASPAGAASAPPSAPATAAGPAQQALTAAYAAYRHIPVQDIAGLRAGTLHVTDASATGTQWATAAFLPILTDPPSVLTGFQDGVSTAVFTRHGDGAWQVLRTSGDQPLGCPGALPASVQQAWGLTSSPACSDAVSQPPVQHAGMAPATASPSSIASIAEQNVGIADSPASTSFSADCNPYTTMVGVGASSSGCGTNSHFGVLNQNEEWCADFAKWAWEQGGVTADLRTLDPAAASFYTWGAQQGESMPTDGTSPKAGDAVVFYPASDGPNGSYADHVGIVVGVNSDGTVNLVNGDFRGSSNISVQADNDVSLASWAGSTWGSGEQWVFVSPGEGSGQSVNLQGSSAVTYGSQMEVFGRDSAGATDSDVYTPSSAAWSGWQDLGGNLADDPTAVQYGTQMQVFGRAASGATYSDVWSPSSGKWSGWQDLDGNLTSGPVAIEYDTPQNGDQMEVYGLAANGQAYSDVWSPSSGKWSGWYSMGGNLTGSLSVAEYGSQIEVFGRDTAGATYSDTYTPSSGTWSGWQNLGGNLTSGPVAVQYDTPQNGDQMEVYGLAANGQTYSDVWSPSSGKWSGWYSMGGNLTGNLTAVSYGSQLEVFGRDSAGATYSDVYTPGSGTWSGWQDLGGTITNDPVATVYGSPSNGDQMEVYGRAANGQTYSDVWSPSSGKWSGWYSMGGNLTG
jgi:hypothetical protein